MGLTRPTAAVRSVWPSAPEARARRAPWSKGRPPVVTRPRRATGTSRTTPIGSPHRGLGVRRPHWTSGLPTPELSTRTFWTFAREFSSLRRHGSATRGATLSPDTVRPVYSCDRAVRCSRQSSPDARARRSPGSEERSAFRGHAAASRDGHVSQAPDRLASPRARRAAAARDVRSADTASPVPKYISSGVCPRNAECGSTRLCSST